MYKPVTHVPMTPDRVLIAFRPKTDKYPAGYPGDSDWGYLAEHEKQNKDTKLVQCAQDLAHDYTTLTLSAERLHAANSFSGEALKECIRMTRKLMPLYKAMNDRNASAVPTLTEEFFGDGGMDYITGCYELFEHNYGKAYEIVDNVEKGLAGTVEGYRVKNHEPDLGPPEELGKLRDADTTDILAWLDKVKNKTDFDALD